MELVNQTIDSRYLVVRRIGGGSFGEVFLGKEVSSQKEVAIKVEATSSLQQCLLYEAKVLKSLQGIKGVPRMRWSGLEGNYNILVMELLGANLQRKFESCQKELSTKDFVQIAVQMVERLKDVHERCYIHRDIKPENFALGLGPQKDVVYVLDFGLAKKYCDPKSRQHVPYRENKSLTGTARYASVNAHLGLEQSRRDDLEAILYTLIYFLRGELPWQGVVARTKTEKYSKIMEKKLSTTVDSLCKGLPLEITAALKYVKGLRFDEDPNYTFLQNCLMKIAEMKRIRIDFVFEWKSGGAKGKQVDVPFKLQRRSKRLMGRRESIQSGVSSSAVSGYSSSDSEETAPADPPHITLEVRNAARSKSLMPVTETQCQVF